MIRHRIQTIATAVLLAALALTNLGLGCKSPSTAVQQASKPITLTWWRVFDGEETVKPIINEYKALHPNVTIVYRKFRYEDYERELLNALAEDRGPDIVSIHATEMRRYQPKLVPMPRQITLPYQEERGGLKKEIVTVLKSSTLPTPREIRSNFVDTVAADVIMPQDLNNPASTEGVYGLPLGIDTLGLYVNRDLLNLGGIPQAPRTWTEFQQATKKLTKLGEGNTILLSGAAMGTSRNVERAADILGLLMMQNGADMLDPSNSRATFDSTPANLARRTVPPGEEALAFYADFANPGKESYTWNAEMPGSLEAFTNGKTALFLGYAYHLPLIRARAPRLNLEVAPIPQIEGNPPVNFANYFVESVSKKSLNPDFAWDFISFAAKAAQAGKYLDATGKAPALRALIAPRAEDPDTGVFVSQVLTAKNWYRGNDPHAAQQAFLDMIDAANKGDTEIRDILRFTSAKITQTLR